jgi:hypothetical protein
MPVIVTKMEQAPPDFSQISGFYGPGAWAAWIITMVASWIPVIQGDYTHNLHFIGYALYTNWAAIDFIRQVNRDPGDNSDCSAAKQARLENTIASIAVMNVGTCQAVGQMLVYIYIVEYKSTRNQRLSAVRRMYLSVGSILPLCMICFGSLSYYELEIGVSICLVFGILIVACVAASVAAHALGGHSSPRSIPPHITFHIYLVIMLVVVILSTLPNYTRWRGTHEVYLECMLPGARCYFVPCAPQSIGEWDQAFTLLVALVFFLYEFGAGMFRLVRSGAAVLVKPLRTPILQMAGHRSR